MKNKYQGNSFWNKCITLNFSNPHQFCHAIKHLYNEILDFCEMTNVVFIEFFMFLTSKIIIRLLLFVFYFSIQFNGVVPFSNSLLH